MSTRKEILADLVEETAELSRSITENSEVSDSLRSELESLCVDVGQASQDFERITDSAIDRLELRLNRFRDSLQSTLREGARDMHDEIISGTIIGNTIGGAIHGLIGGAINQAIQRRATDPDWVRARRIYNAIKIVIDSYKAGGRNNRSATLKFLRIHDFTPEQAEYFLDLLIQAKIVKEFDCDGKTFLMVDFEAKTFQMLNDGYQRNTLTNLTFDAPLAKGELVAPDDD